MADFAQIGIDGAILLMPGLAALLAYSAWVRRVPANSLLELIFVVVTAKITQYLASHVTVGMDPEWIEAANAVASVVAALICALIIAAYSLMMDRRRRKRRLDISNANSEPMNWSTMFRGERKHTLLHLKSGGQLFGWPEGWPQDAEKGHFLLSNPRYLGDRDIDRPVTPVAIVVPVADVIRVEFINSEQLIALEHAEAKKAKERRRNGPQIILEK